MEIYGKGVDLVKNIIQGNTLSEYNVIVDNMSIKIPTKLDNILTGEYRAMVDTAFSRFKDIYTDNKLDFFQDYTDHGIEHIEAVLETAANIIDEDSFQLLNEKDIAVLIISILLHDVGMHISKEGLKKILDPEWDKWRVHQFDCKSWNEEWTHYFHEAKRFNDEQLKNIFGTSDQIITEPNIDFLDDYNRKLYGEFLRRFHHRLAHEIALGGFPTQIGIENINIHSGDIEHDIVDLAGLIARSHGMPIRKAIDYLEIKFQDAWRAPYNIKAIFLMVVLRIADYLQINSERASKIILKSKRFSSPISKKEWEKHNSIKDINIKTADPERIFVIAKPENSVIYLELEKLFEDIQAEFDISWAILGEAYGKDNELKKLKINFRRIRSVLDDKEEFNKTIRYIPEKIYFNADPALLKLLIGPLYGEDPKYGVRELLQNSIDAIKEREFLSGVQGKVSISLKPVKKDKPRYEIVISDSGIGMTKDTIINYFFKAGASFRKSMTWKKNFIDDDEVKIQKTGRFGVGVLAAFLLGDEFELWSKYDSLEAQGYYCKAALGMTQVELNKENCEVGTTIRILLKESVNALINAKLKELEDDKKKNDLYSNKPSLLEWFTWYVMDSPKIDYSIDVDLIKAFRFIKLFISSNPEIPSANWRYFYSQDYKAIHWIIDLKERLYSRNRDVYDELSCNGFKINKSYRLGNSSYQWLEPKISVFDNNAKFPLSLNRDYIQEDKLPFEDELLESISLAVLKAILRTEFYRIGPYYLPKPNILKFNGEIDLSDYIVVIGDEFTLLNSSIFSFLNLSSFDQFWLKSLGKDSKEYKFLPQKAYQASVLKTDPIYFYKRILEAPSYNIDRYNHWFNLGDGRNSRRNDSFSRTYISASKLEFLLQGSRLSKSYKYSLSSQSVNKNWSEISSDKRSQHKSHIDPKKLSTDTYPIIIERYTKGNETDSSFFINSWTHFLGKEWTFPIEKDKRPVLPKKRN